MGRPVDRDAGTVNHTPQFSRASSAPDAGRPPAAGEWSTADAEANVAMPRKVLLVANTAWYLYNFRRGLIRALVGQGSDVAVVCPWDRYVALLEADGVRWIEWSLDRAGMSLLRDWRSLRRLRRVYLDESPELVHHFTIKSILYGTAAARRGGVRRIVNSVTGLGHVFVSDRLAARVVRPWIRRWYLRSLTAPGVRPIFQNADDLTVLSCRSHELATRAILSNGSGVDVDRFASSPKGPLEPDEVACVLFVGRLLEEKGIREFVEAAHLLQKRGLRARFVACGAPDPGNPSSMDPARLEQWHRERVVEFPGHVDGVEGQMHQADVIVLPSYREGTPRVLLEAAAMGKPVVASDVPGCRDVVTHGHNGLLVPPRDPQALADAVEQVLADESLRDSMGRAGRKLAVERYDERHVVRQTLSAYDDLCRSEVPDATGRDRARLDKGVLLLSLDFELAWGTRGRPAARHCGPFWSGTRKAIRGLLELFERYEVPATWAVVGALLLGRGRSKERHPWLDDPGLSDIPAGDSTTQPQWYAEDVLEAIVSHPVAQEIACHTLTHRFIEPGSDGRRVFREELQRFRTLCDELYLEQPTTFIYPKAKMAHFDILLDEGFRSIRGPESKWFESLPGTRIPAALRLMDARLARPPRVDLPERLPCGLWVLPSSQFYSPFLSVGKYLSVSARVRKAVKGLRLAAERKQVYHLWTHPFNLGVRTEELLAGLDEILQEARRLSDAGRLEVMSMAELTGKLEAGRAIVTDGLPLLERTDQEMEVTRGLAMKE